MLITRYPTTSRFQPGVRRQPGAKDLPVCPVCDSLQCLCRPRFFAGQLLTEEDLNRLDRYIRGKHRLHNRHLHGWGVVCGLEVTCHECENLVKVSAGYALSPCGDDIVACDDHTVDVCDLIRKCRKEDRRCEPPRRQPNECDDVEETWVLAICYDEKPSRGITALRTAGACCAKCSGSGSSCTCGCGCQEHTNGYTNGATYPSAKKTPAQCEPTVICEGYRYDVYRLPPGSREDDDERGALIDRFMCCVQPYIDFARELREPFGSLTGASPSQQFQLCCTMKAHLREILLSRPIHDCTLLERLDQIRCTAEPGVTITHTILDTLGDNAALLNSVAGFSAGQTVTVGADTTNAETMVIQSITNNEVRFNTNFDNDHEVGETVQFVGAGSLNAFVELVYIWFQALLDCLCSVLLPPCPAPAEDNCVPLATVTIRKRDCRILRVCNWTTHRKFATTFPNLQYWLSWLPYGRLLRDLIERICCELPEIFRIPQRDPTGSTVPGTPPSTPAPGAVPFSAGPGAETRTGTFDTTPFTTARGRSTSNLVFEAATGLATPLDPQTLFLGLMGATRDNAPNLTDAERDNLAPYLLLGQLGAPLFRALTPDTLSDKLGVAAFGLRRATAEAPQADVNTLRGEFEQLRSMVEQQQKVIDALNARLGDDS